MPHGARRLWQCAGGHGQVPSRRENRRRSASEVKTPNCFNLFRANHTYITKQLRGQMVFSRVFSGSVTEYAGVGTFLKPDGLIGWLNRAPWRGKAGLRRRVFAEPLELGR